MAFLDIKNIVVKGIAACVPKQVEDNRHSPLLGSPEDIAKFIETTSITRRHVVGNSGICTSDLCVVAAECNSTAGSTMAKVPGTPVKP